MLYELGHRGERATGIAVYGPRFLWWFGGIKVKSRNQSIYKSFKGGKELAKFEGHYGTGHNRYPTAGTCDERHVQPMEQNAPFGKFEIAHNGTIKNANELRRYMGKDGEKFKTAGDTEVIAKLIASGSDIVSGLKIAASEVTGSYSLTLLTGEGVYAVRDPYGMKPLVVGRDQDGGIYFASESCAFTNGVKLERDLERGEVFFAGPDGEFRDSIGQKERKLDIFELIYFARPDSIIDGISVAEYRLERGRRLARKDVRAHGLDFFDSDFIVVPVNDSGRYYGIGYHEELCRLTGRWIPYVEGMMRKKHERGERSFIQDDHKERVEVASNKLATIAPLIRGKKVASIEDCYVRGVTSKITNRMLRNAGAKEVHGRSGYAEVVDCCPHGGIDMKTPEEQIAVAYPNIEERSRNLDFDTMLYNDVEDLIPDGASLGEFCTFCVDHRDPFAATSSKTSQQ